MKKQTHSRHRGFTLIELLVVIAIIGLLSTMAVIQLNDARAKARDARRISDVKQLATIIEMESTESPVSTIKTGAAPGVDAPVDTIVKTCTLPGQVAQFANFEDPSDDDDTACVNAGTAPCEYAISSKDGLSGASVDDYQICFNIEKGAGSLSAGFNSIETGSMMVVGCD